MELDEEENMQAIASAEFVKRVVDCDVHIISLATSSWRLQNNHSDIRISSFDCQERASRAASRKS